MPSQINKGPQCQSYTCTRKLLKRLAYLAFVLTIITAPVSAQAPATTSATSTSASPTSHISSSSTLTTSARPNTVTTTSPSTTKPPTTFKPLAVPTYTQTGPTGLPSGSSYLPGGKVDADISQYYYIIILAGALVLAALVWLLHLRRRRRKLLSRNSRRSALAQDLEGVPSHRRWLHGAWRGSDGHPRREEGLDERGEAPPPYKPAAARHSSNFSESDDRGESSRGSDTISIPLQTYHPSSSHSQKPPEYGEVIRRVDPAALSPEPPSNRGTGE